MQYADKILPCMDCGKDFLFLAAEQKFFADKKLLNLPKRCEKCRVLRKLIKEGKDPRQFKEIPCDYCGAMTLIPFRPSGRKPVYCVSCYRRIEKQFPQQ